MDALDLLESHRFREAIEACQRGLADDPDDLAAVDTMASALLGAGDYARAMSFFQRMDDYERNELEGHQGRRMDISCLLWCMNDHPPALALMRDMVNGVLDGSINYGDAAGGVTQGLLLYYMSITMREENSAALALRYLRNRARRSAARLWPGPLARYMLGEIKWDAVLTAATKRGDLASATQRAHDDLLSRRQLCAALFHDGIKRRAQGAEDLCLQRMQQCIALKDPLIELEWYLARYEVEETNRRA
jgi:hypothetical protein